MGSYLYSREGGAEAAGLVLGDEEVASRGQIGGTAIEAANAGQEGQEAAVDIKRAHFRSAAALLQAAQREGIVTLTEASPGALTIQSVNRTHIAFRNVRLANPDALRAHLEEKDGRSAKISAELEQDRKEGKKLDITATELVKMPRNLRDIFCSLGGSSRGEPKSYLGESGAVKEYFTTGELKDLLVAYFGEWYILT